jgi:hypothetical protein
MDMSYKGIWGYHPLLISLAETREPLRIVNRSGNQTSEDGAAFECDAVADYLQECGFRKIVSRGDTAYSQTEHLDRWDERGKIDGRSKSARLPKHHITRTGITAVGIRVNGSDDEIVESVSVDVAPTAHRATGKSFAATPSSRKPVVPSSSDSSTTAAASNTRDSSVSVDRTLRLAFRRAEPVRRTKTERERVNC